MTDPDVRLIRFVEEAMERCPAVRQPFSDVLLTELKEEIAQANPDQANTAIRLIERAEEKWSNDT